MSAADLDSSMQDDADAEERGAGAPPMPPADTLTEQFDANLRSWNERVAIHLKDESGIYDIEAFKAGAESFTPIEAAELGDIEGHTIAHLQCHLGIDTISLARRGANVTGLDFSPAAIAQARGFADREACDVRFVHGTVYDAPKLLAQGRFDLVFATWGTINWLPDVARWAEVVSALLKPGGELYFADIHPFMAQLESDGEQLVFDYPRRVTGASEAMAFDDMQSYAGDGTKLVNQRTYEWIHPLGDILDALDAADLDLLQLKEHDELPWRAVPEMIPARDKLFRLPDGMNGPAVALSLRARKRS
ncbi:MAG: class I SAM-dependent methyltransferase [Pseudomonadota bacterium]